MHWGMDQDTQTVGLELPKRRRFTDAERSSHVSAWAASGLSAKAYGQEHGVDPRNLYAWRSRERRQVRDVSRAEGASSFVPVRINGWPGSKDALKLALHMPGGCRIDVSGISSVGEVITIVHSLQTQERCV